MGASQGRRALIIFVVSIVVTLVVMGGLYTYIPSIRPYMYFVYVAVVFGIGFGACLVLNAYGGTGIKRAEKY